jgi:cysteine desulfurase/selenocysteine lyase
MDRFDLPSTARASLGLYNTKEDIDILADSLEKVREIFR